MATCWSAPLFRIRPPNSRFRTGPQGLAGLPPGAARYRIALADNAVGRTPGPLTGVWPFSWDMLQLVRRAELALGRTPGPLIGVKISRHTPQQLVDGGNRISNILWLAPLILTPTPGPLPAPGRPFPIARVPFTTESGTRACRADRGSAAPKTKKADVSACPSEQNSTLYCSKRTTKAERNASSLLRTTAARVSASA
jgi:hypothetical protein